MDGRGNEPSTGVGDFIQSPVAGLAFAVMAGGGMFASRLLWGHHRALAVLALVVGVVGLALLWADQAVEWRGDLQREGIERHTLERAGLITVLVGLPCLVLYGLVVRLTKLSNPDPWNLAVGGFFVFVLTRARLRSRLTGE